MSERPTEPMSDFDIKDPMSFLDSDMNDDPELLAALAAAFGDSAVESSQLDNLDGESLVSQVSLDEGASVAESLQALITRLDSKMAELDDVAIVTRDAEKPKSNFRESAEAKRYVLFESGQRQAAFPLSGIVEIERMPPTTALPRTPSWLRGIANLRGSIVSITDLADLVGSSGQSGPACEPPRPGQQKVIVVHSKISNATTAIVVDRIVGIRGYAGMIVDRPDNLTDPLALLADKIARTPEGLVLLINPDQLFSHPAMQPFITPPKSANLGLPSLRSVTSPTLPAAGFDRDEFTNLDS